ncbi:MAG TPA: glycoside hydrolase family 127 protein, partial [Bacteroidales bacterium]|nr:glycoside hydrolase family 127 protein [Bacteroidales bacterium]
GSILSYMVREDASFTTEFVHSLLEGTRVIKTTGSQTRKTLEGKIETLGEDTITLIPYALWNNRGSGQMKVWLPTSTLTTHPLPAPTIAYRSTVRAGKFTKDIPSINDQFEPSSSNDPSVPYYHWWPDKNKMEWVEYDFEKPEIISKTRVYWFDDGQGGGCRVPDDWEILYLNDNMWEPVAVKNRYKVTKNGWDSLLFEPVKTSAIKMRVYLNKDFSGGIYEWVVE